MAGFLGLSACALFWIALLILGWLRPGYSQAINDISELGALGTSNAWLWNVIGFVIPGLCLAVLGRAIADSADAGTTLSGRFGAWLLPLFGLGVATQGLSPALMENGLPLVTSWHTRVHLIASLVSGAAWLFAVLLLTAPMRRQAEWRSWHVFNVVAVLLVIGGSLGRGKGLPDGTVQRAVDAVVFAWFILASVKLIRLGGRSSPG